MKKLFILIVFAAVYLHFYPQPKLTHWFEKQKTMLLAKISKATDTKVRLKADKIFSDLKSDLNSFNEEEVSLLKKITANPESVRVFFEKYCQGSDNYNPSLQTENLKKVCHTIDRYQSLL